MKCHLLISRQNNIVNSMSKSITCYFWSLIVNCLAFSDFFYHFTINYYQLNIFYLLSDDFPTSFIAFCVYMLLVTCYSAWLSVGGWYSGWEALGPWCPCWHHMYSDSSYFYQYSNTKASRFVKFSFYFWFEVFTIALIYLPGWINLKVTSHHLVILPFSADVSIRSRLLALCLHL